MIYLIKASLRNPWSIVGLMMAVGCLPLLCLIVLDRSVQGSQGNLNSSFLWFFLLAKVLLVIACFGMGILRVVYQHCRYMRTYRALAEAPLLWQPVLRIVWGLTGVLLIACGVLAMVESNTLIALVVLVIAVLVLCWAMLGRVPRRFKR